jgi:acyl-CoA synthetase (AMP-forming)/AMP-acid ligase II
MATASFQTPTSRDASALSALTQPGGVFEIRQGDVRGIVMPVFASRMRTLREVLNSTRRFGSRTYLVDGDTRLSYEEHLRSADDLACALQSVFGVRPGDRAAIFAANRWEWVVCFWAIVAAGAIPCLMNGWWTAEEFGHAAAAVEPALVFADRERAGRVASSGVAVATVNLDDIPRLLDEHAGAGPQPSQAQEDDPAVLIFTSGTTGKPKAAVLSHRSVIGFTQVNALLEIAAKVDFGMIPAPASYRELPPGDDVALVTIPLFHVSGLHGYAILTLVRGSAIVLLPGRFDPGRALRAIERERVTAWSPLGSLATRVAAYPELANFDTSSLNSLRLGGAPVSPAVQEALRTAVPTAAKTLSVSYTSTEAGAVIATINGADRIAHPTSVGRVNPTLEVEIRDESGRRVPDGRDGEVHVRSPYNMLGYWRDRDASAAVLKENSWLAMGDIARIEDGLLYINSRARDLILVNAENVSPTEVEYVLEEHPGIGEAAVLAVDDEITGDAVCAVVVPRAGASLTADGLAGWCRPRLAYYKIPTRWQIEAAPLPRTASGKLVKHVLREKFN